MCRIAMARRVGNGRTSPRTTTGSASFGVEGRWSSSTSSQAYLRVRPLHMAYNCNWQAWCIPIQFQAFFPVDYKYLYRRGIPVRVSVPPITSRIESERLPGGLRTTWLARFRSWRTLCPSLHTMDASSNASSTTPRQARRTCKRSGAFRHHKHHKLVSPNPTFCGNSRTAFRPRASSYVARTRMP